MHILLKPALRVLAVMSPSTGEITATRRAASTLAPIHSVTPLALSGSADAAPGRHHAVMVVAANRPTLAYRRGARCAPRDTPCVELAPVAAHGLVLALKELSPSSVVRRTPGDPSSSFAHDFVDSQAAGVFRLRFNVVERNESGHVLAIGDILRTISTCSFSHVTRCAINSPSNTAATVLSSEMSWASPAPDHFDVTDRPFRVFQ